MAAYHKNNGDAVFLSRHAEVLFEPFEHFTTGNGIEEFN